MARKRTREATTPDDRSPGTGKKPGRPGLDSPALAARNRDWLAMHEGLGWTYARIAGQVGMSPRAVGEGVRAAREARAAAGVEGTPGPTPVVGRAVGEWLDARRGRRHGG